MSKYLTVVFVAMVLLCAFAPTPAKANSIDTFVFQTFSFNNTYTWQAPASPTPTSFCQNPGVPVYCFGIAADVAVNGTDFGSTTITFHLNSPNNGDLNGFSIPALNISGFGPALWSGPNSSPTFILGTYQVGSDVGPQVGTLTISSASTDVPEPFVLLQTGAGLLVGLAVITFWRKEPAGTTCS
jgi:hypothetical protein